MSAFRATADKLVRDAELEDDSDAKEVMEQLVAMAKKHGLYE